MLEAGDGKVQSDLYKALVMAADLGIIDANETRYDEPVSRSEAIDMMVKVGQALNEKEGYLNEEAGIGIGPTIIPTDEDKSDLLEGLPELPPVEVFYNAEYDFDTDGTMSKAEWEQWCKDHPEDTNQNMTLKDEQQAQQEQQQETQTPVIPSDGGGNPDSSAGNDAGQSTGNQGGSGNTGGNSGSVNPGNQGTQTTTPPTDTGSQGNQNTGSSSGDLAGWDSAEQKEEWEQKVEDAGGTLGGSGGVYLP